MSNLASKLAIGGSVIIVLLMLFSAVPVAADGSENNGVDIDVSINTSDSGEKWSWDGTDCILTLEDGLVAKSIEVHMNNASPDKTVTVVVNGNITLEDKDNEYGSDLTIHSDVKATITGGANGGRIFSDYGCINHFEAEGTGAEPALYIENVSLNLRGELTSPIYAHFDVVIDDCPVINLHSVSSGAVVSFGSFSISNSGFNIESESGELIDTEDGIYLPSEFYGNNLLFDGGTEWLPDGQVKVITSTDANCTLSSNPLSPNNNTPIVIGIFVVLLAIVAVGTYVVYRK